MTLTLTDLFCGAGGSSTGAIAFGNVTVKTAANHWAKAIETHSLNHPDADHIQADLSQMSWLGFTAFVGANLFQSGFTRFCPLETILIKLGVAKASPAGSCA